jgi:hypothetical protein
MLYLIALLLLSTALLTLSTAYFRWRAHVSAPGLLANLALTVGTWSVLNLTTFLVPLPLNFFIAAAGISALTRAYSGLRPKNPLLTAVSSGLTATFLFRLSGVFLDLALSTRPLRLAENSAAAYFDRFTNSAEIRVTVLFWLLVSGAQVIGGVWSRWSPSRAPEASP